MLGCRIPPLPPPPPFRSIPTHTWSYDYSKPMLDNKHIHPPKKNNYNSKVACHHHTWRHERETAHRPLRVTQRIVLACLMRHLSHGASTVFFCCCCCCRFRNNNTSDVGRARFVFKVSGAVLQHYQYRRQIVSLPFFAIRVFRGIQIPGRCDLLARVAV